MSWFTKRRHLRLDPIALAEMLHQILVEEDTPHSVPHPYHLPESIYETFRERIFLYREALVLMTLVTQSQADPLFLPTLREYERILFQDGPEEAIRSGRLSAIKNAMEELTDLLLKPRSDPYLSWCRRWFAEIGHDESNPITLMLFLTFWMDWYIAVRESLNKMVVK